MDVVGGVVSQHHARVIVAMDVAVAILRQVDHKGLAGGVRWLVATQLYELALQVTD